MSETKNCQNCPVWKKSLFKDFDENLLSHVEKIKTYSVLKKGESLFDQDSSVLGLYCHGSGLAKVIQKDLQTEKIRFTRLVYPGDTSGHRSIFIESKYKGTAQIVSEEAEVCFIPTSEVLFFLSQNPTFAQNLIIKISNELNLSEEEKLAAKERTVRGRLAQLLFTLANQYSEQLNESEFMVRSEITKREIANLLLVADETIIRLMSDMQKEGLLRYEGRSLILTDLLKMHEQTKY
jgi:CRP-like cAMP-binding protein